MKKSSCIWKSAAALFAVLLLAACNPLEKLSDSSSMLSVVRIQGTDYTGERADFLHSDVLVVDETTGQGSIYADFGYATLRVDTLNPNPALGTSQYSDIIVNRYIVTYTLPDGSGQEGRDVPYSFEGYLSALIKAGTSDEIGFIVVREVAKTEPPLASLVDGTNVLQVRAKIEFYGQDLVEKKVKATGYLTIYFANYVDR